MSLKFTPYFVLHPLTSNSFVTAPCTNGAIGPLRNCGFVEVEVEDPFCEAGTAVELTLPDLSSYPVIFRVCERNGTLGTGIAYTYQTLLVNKIITNPPEPASFTCPTMRDSSELEGGFALYTAPIFKFEHERIGKVIASGTKPAAATD